MKYQAIRKKIKSSQIVMLTLILPGSALLVFGPSVLALVFHDIRNFCFFLLWLLPAGAFWCWRFVQCCCTGKKLKQIMQTVGAETDADMERLLEQAEQFEDYFVTDTHYINFTTLSAYARSEVCNLKRYERKRHYRYQPGESVHYCISLQYGGGKRDRFMTREKESRDGLWKVMIRQQRKDRRLHDMKN